MSTLAKRGKPVHIGREQREGLFNMLREAERYRESFIKTRVDTSVVRKARRIVMNFDNRTRTLERRAHEAIHREAKLVRELILFGSDVQAALTAVKRFRAQR